MVELIGNMAIDENAVSMDNDVNDALVEDAKEIALSIVSFMIGFVCILYIAINIGNIYTHISAEKLPKSLAGPTVNAAGKNSLIAPYADNFSKKYVHDGDYLVVNYTFNNVELAQSITPLKAGHVTVNSFKTNANFERENNKVKYQNNDMVAGLDSRIVHTREHNIIDWRQLLYVGDAASLLSIMGILYLNAIQRKKKASNTIESIGSNKKKDLFPL